MVIDARRKLQQFMEQQGDSASPRVKEFATLMSELVTEIFVPEGTHNLHTFSSLLRQRLLQFSSQSQPVQQTRSRESGINITYGASDDNGNATDGLLTWSSDWC